MILERLRKLKQPLFTAMASRKACQSSSGSTSGSTPITVDACTPYPPPPTPKHGPFKMAARPVRPIQRAAQGQLSPDVSCWTCACVASGRGRSHQFCRTVAPAEDQVSARGARRYRLIIAMDLKYFYHSPCFARAMKKTERCDTYRVASKR